MNISARDMNEITQNWSGELSNWRATASNDENAYEIADDDFSKAYDSGKDTAKDKTGYEGGKGGMGVRSAVDVVAGTGGAIISSGVIGAVGSSITQNVVTKTAAKAAEKTLTEAGKEVTKEAVKETATKTTKNIRS